MSLDSCAQKFPDEAQLRYRHSVNSGSQPGVLGLPGGPESHSRESQALAYRIW